MTTSIHPVLTIEVRTAPLWRGHFVGEAETRRAKIAQQAEAQADGEAHETLAAGQTRLAARDLVIEIDREAGRFVNILKEADSDEIVRRYPQEAQLAFARAVRAYEKALAEDL